MNDLLDKFFIYLECLFKGKLPIKYQGIYIIENIWVIHYSCLSVNPMSIDDLIKRCIHIRYKSLHDKFLYLKATDKFLYLKATDKFLYLKATDEDLKALNNLFENTLKAFVTLDSILKKQSIFFNQFKLQDYSEYKTERRNSILNNLIN